MPFLHEVDICRARTEKRKIHFRKPEILLAAMVYQLFLYILNKHKASLLKEGAYSHQNTNAR